VVIRRQLKRRHVLLDHVAPFEEPEAGSCCAEAAASADAAAVSSETSDA
jgi:hypothetical protein